MAPLPTAPVSDVDVDDIGLRAGKVLVWALVEDVLLGRVPLPAGQVLDPTDSRVGGVPRRARLRVAVHEHRDEARWLDPIPPRLQHRDPRRVR